jgi:hypothetical protein
MKVLRIIGDDVLLGCVINTTKQNNQHLELKCKPYITNIYHKLFFRRFQHFSWNIIADKENKSKSFVRLTKLEQKHLFHYANISYLCMLIIPKNVLCFTFRLGICEVIYV